MLKEYFDNASAVMIDGGVAPNVEEK